MSPNQTNAELQRSLDEALRLIDKLNGISVAILRAITEKGSLTKDEYNRIYAQALAEWEQRQAAPKN